MNDQFQFFLGVDVSKSTLDFVLLGKAGTVLQRGQIANDESSWENLIQLLDRSPSWQATLDVPQTLICAEFTGMYTYHVTAWVGRGAQLWLQSGKEIKHSQGIVRGKDDQTDAWRIAHYAKTKVDKVQLWKPLSETLETLRLLLSLRDRLLKRVLKKVCHCGFPDVPETDREARVPTPRGSNLNSPVCNTG